MSNFDIHYTNLLPEVGQYFTLFESSGWNKDYLATPEELLSTIKES